MRKRFLVLSTVAAMALAALAGPASADTLVTATVSCKGAFAYSASYSLEVSQLPAGITLPYSKTYSFPTYRGTETCTVSIG